MAIFNRNKHSQKRRVYTSNQQIDIPIKNAVINVHEQKKPEEPEEAGIPENMFEKCPECARAVFGEDLADNLHVCMYCGHHFRMPARERIAITVDEGSFVEFGEGLVGENPWSIRGMKRSLTP